MPIILIQAFGNFVSTGAIEMGQGVNAKILAVAEAALHALFAEDPLPRYLVVPNESNAAWAIDKLGLDLLRCWKEKRQMCSLPMT